MVLRASCCWVYRIVSLKKMVQWPPHGVETRRKGAGVPTQQMIWLGGSASDYSNKKLVPENISRFLGRLFTRGTCVALWKYFLDKCYSPLLISFNLMGQRSETVVVMQDKVATLYVENLTFCGLISTPQSLLYRERIATYAEPCFILQGEILTQPNTAAGVERWCLREIFLILQVDMAAVSSKALPCSCTFGCKKKSRRVVIKCTDSQQSYKEDRIVLKMSLHGRKSSRDSYNIIFHSFHSVN